MREKRATNKRMHNAGGAESHREENAECKRH